MKKLKGKTIHSVEHMGEEQATDIGWSKRPIVITFTDGSILVPMSDDEGNEGGAAIYAYEGLEDVIGTM